MFQHVCTTQHASRRCSEQVNTSNTVADCETSLHVNQELRADRLSRDRVAMSNGSRAAPNTTRLLTYNIVHIIHPYKVIQLASFTPFLTMLLS